MAEFEPGDIVICTVERIVGTVIFVKIHDVNKDIEGSIIISEIAPGRIRNLRDYVVPKKKIVCKVLRISPKGNVELSLRRVTQKEKKEALEEDRQEKGYISILKSVIGKKTDEVIEKIKEKEKIYDFFQDIKDNPEILEEFVGEKDSKRITDILKIQKQKKSSIKKEILLSTSQPNGIELIKELLSSIKDAKIKYISAGRYSIETESEDIKKTDNKLKDILDFISKTSKEKKLNFEVKEK